MPANDENHYLAWIFKEWNKKKWDRNCESLGKKLQTKDKEIWNCQVLKIPCPVWHSGTGWQRRKKVGLKQPPWEEGQVEGGSVQQGHVSINAELTKTVSTTPECSRV